MVWIYGGALQFGHGGTPAYDGSAFATHEDVVYVTFNYRTNSKWLRFLLLLKLHILLF